MPYNGSGTFTPYTPGNPVVSGTVISSTAFNATQSDIAAGLTNAVTRDGQSPPSANLPMGGKKLTGLAAGAIAGDSLRWEQLFSQGTEQDIASAATTDIGALNTTVARITGTTTITSLGTNYNGPRYVRFAGVLTLTHNATTLILPTGANITTAAGDSAIFVPKGNPADGWNCVEYQRASGAAVLALPVASETVQGIVELATDAEAQAGTDTARAITAANLKAAQIQLGTAVTLTTQTSVDFTSIPSWAKRITVMFNGVSTNGTSPPILQFGDSGGIETTGYLGSAGVVGASTAASSLFTNGIGLINATAATVVMQGAVTLSLMTGTTWVASGVLTRSDSAGANLVGGSKATSAALDRIRLTTSGGTDQFDAGSVNISWE